MNMHEMNKITNQKDEESEIIKDVISLKKEEYRVEIRRKKIKIELQSKRLKTTSQESVDQNMRIPFLNSFSSQQDYQIHSENMNSNQEFQISNQFIHTNTNYELIERISNDIPQVTEFKQQIDGLVLELENYFKIEDIESCSEIIQILQSWIMYYSKERELFEAEKILGFCVKANIHNYCSAFISMKYKEQKQLQFNSYYVLAQITVVIDKQGFNDMITQNIFNNLKESLLNQQDPFYLDYMFQTMGNLAGDSEYGKYFCSEIANIGIVKIPMNIVSKFNKEGIKIFIESYLFYLQNLFKSIPKQQRNEIFEFLDQVIQFLKHFPIDNVRIMCTQNLMYLFSYNHMLSNKITQDDQAISLISLLDDGESQKIGIQLMQQIVFISNDDVIQLLVKNSMISQLSKIIQKGTNNSRKKCAFILSNIATIPDQTIQDFILQEQSFKIFMKALLGDRPSVMQELEFFLLNLIKSATPSTILALSEKQIISPFLMMIFEKYETNFEILMKGLCAFQIFFQEISLCAPLQVFIKIAQQVEEIGLFSKIENLITHPNQEISNLAEDMYNKLNIGELLSTQTINNRDEDNNNYFEK